MSNSKVACLSSQTREVTQFIVRFRGRKLTYSNISPYYPCAGMNFVDDLIAVGTFYFIDDMISLMLFLLEYCLSLGITQNFVKAVRWCAIECPTVKWNLIWFLGGWMVESRTKSEDYIKIICNISRATYNVSLDPSFLYP